MYKSEGSGGPPISKTADYASEVSSYYDIQAPLYDASRWMFLMGRRHLISALNPLTPGMRVLEIGCGTGHNLVLLDHACPGIQKTGIDLSGAMLDQAKTKFGDRSDVSLQKVALEDFPLDAGGFDLVFSSYCLSMTGDLIADLERARQLVRPGGYFAAMDFHHTRFGWFERWLKMNHVNIDRPYLATLERLFDPKMVEVRKAYMGWWRYFMFLGRKPLTMA